MDKTFPYIYPDPTKPVIPNMHKHPSLSWILFVGFNLLLPFLFLGAYLWLNK